MTQCGTVIGPLPDLFMAISLLDISAIQVNGQETEVSAGLMPYSSVRLFALYKEWLKAPSILG